MATLTAIPPDLAGSRQRRRRREVRRLLVRRLALIPVIVLLLSWGVFLLAQYSPFDPLVGYLGDRYQYMTPQQRAELTRSLELDRGWWQAWCDWATALAGGDLGTSRSYREPVADVLAQRLPWTVLLSSLGLAMATLLALGGALVAALFPDSAWDRGVERLGLALQALPAFVMALGLVLVLSVGLGWFPAGGATSVRGGGGSLDVARHLLLPVVVLALSQVPWLLLTLRAQVREVLGSDAVRSAMLRGLPWPIVVRGHVLPVCLAPLVTMLGVRLPELVVGAVVVEECFAWPGVAAAMVRAGRDLDLPLLAALTVASTVLVLVGSLLADLAQLAIDPRVRSDG